MIDLSLLSIPVHNLLGKGKQILSLFRYQSILQEASILNIPANLPPDPIYFCKSFRQEAARVGGGRELRHSAATKRAVVLRYFRENIACRKRLSFWCKLSKIVMKASHCEVC